MSKTRYNQIEPALDSCIYDHGSSKVIGLKIKSTGGLERSNDGASAKMKGSGGINTDADGFFVEANGIIDSMLASDFLKVDGSNAMTGDLPAGANKIVNVADPVNDTDVTNKRYVDAKINGLDPKANVEAGFTSQKSLTGVDGTLVSDPGGPDEHIVLDGESVALMGQTDPTENGLYSYAIGGGNYTLTRRTDADANAEVTAGMYFHITGGEFKDTKRFLTTNDPINVGTDALVFDAFGGPETLTFGNGVQKIGQDVSANVDGFTIEISGIQELKVKDAGITKLQLGGLSIATGNLIDGAVTAVKLADDLWHKQDFPGDGATFAFTLDFLPQANSMSLYRNRLLEKEVPGGAETINSYSITGTNLTYGVIANAPGIGEELIAKYMKAA